MTDRSAITSAPLGYNAHGQKVTLFAQRQDGVVHHTIQVAPRTFKDQVQLVEGLTADNIRAAAAALEGAPK